MFVLKNAYDEAVHFQRVTTNPHTGGATCLHAAGQEGNPKKKLNGRRGTVHEFCPLTGIWLVELEVEEKEEGSAAAAAAAGEEKCNYMVTVPITNLELDLQDCSNVILFGVVPRRACPNWAETTKGGKVLLHAGTMQGKKGSTPPGRPE
jgi:hypothetical protein